MPDARLYGHENIIARIIEEENSLKNAVRTILKGLGEDPDREGLKETPSRVEKSLKFLTSGYSVDADALIHGALFDEAYDEMVVVRDVEFYSLCEHHLIPFFGKCHVAYLPDGKIVGLSKIPRLVEAYSRRLQVQERLTTQIADTISKHVKPRGVGVVMEARHLCMCMRGVQKENVYAVTSSMTGVFKSDSRTRMEFLNLISKRDGLRV
ncbi:MAG: GTP cyclohydrolase I FolE [Nitrospinae bacterium]|nr:GTP cyclohydrolase I FolE [Nitrospinota bacterium]